MITEDCVSFEIAKLLKEKGFDEACNYRYYETHFGFELGLGLDYTNSHWEDWYKDTGVRNYSAPTLQMATKWLRKNFNMNPVPYATSIGWYFEVFDLTQRDITGCALLYQVGIPSKEKTFETSEEACEAGIRYCLENLI